VSEESGERGDLDERADAGRSVGRVDGDRKVDIESRAGMLPVDRLGFVLSRGSGGKGGIVDDEGTAEAEVERGVRR